MKRWSQHVDDDQTGTLDLATEAEAAKAEPQNLQAEPQNLEQATAR